MDDGYPSRRRDTPVRERIRAGVIRVAVSLAALVAGIIAVVLSLDDDSYDGDNAPLQTVGVLMTLVAGMLLLVFSIGLLVECAFWLQERHRRKRT